MKALVAIVLALVWLLAIPILVLGAEDFGYEEIKARGANLTDQVNQERSPNLARKYGLHRIAYNRSLARAEERDATGTSEFAHNLNPIVNYLENNNICYNWVGEVVGYSSTVDTDPTTNIPHNITQRWMGSTGHRNLITASSGDWGGGSWVRSNSGTYFFAFYVVDVCGI